MTSKVMYRVLILALLAAVVLTAPASAAEVITVIFNDATDYLVYSLTGGDAGQAYIVTGAASGCVTMPPGDPPDLVGAVDKDSVKVNCASPNGTGTIALAFYKGSVSPANEKHAESYAFQCGASCQVSGYPIPTLSEWALIALAVLLVGLLTYYIVRRRRAAIAAV